MIGSSQRNDHLWNRTYTVIDSPVGSTSINCVAMKCGKSGRWIQDFPGSKSTIKQTLAAVWMSNDFLVVRQIGSLLHRFITRAE
jgi:hypothetical protein